MPHTRRACRFAGTTVARRGGLWTPGTTTDPGFPAVRINSPTTPRPRTVAGRGRSSSRPAGQLTPAGGVVVTKPAFREINVIGERPISTQSQSRDGTPIDLFLFHTTEGAGGGEALIAFMERMGDRSYHYLVDNDPDGNTVYDLVDTDLASWSVLDANDRSINLVIGASFAAWSRQEWIDNARNAVRIGAWLAVQDCRKYGFTPRVIKPPYPLDPPGISDHKYVTEHLGIGDHTDMGDNFIWDLLESDVNEFLGASLSTDQKIDYVFDELSKLFASRSPYREDDNPFETAVGVLLMVDRSEHMRLVEDAALRGEPWAVEKVKRLANGEGPGAWLWYSDADGNRQQDTWAIEHAKAVYKKVPASAKKTT